MKRPVVLGIIALAFTSTTLLAQTGQPSYQGDPDTYKKIFEDDNLRVIAVTWKASSTDKPHTHPVPGVVYYLSDCTLRIHNADGTTREVSPKAGTAGTVPIAAQPHRAENLTPADCRAVIVERK